MFQWWQPFFGLLVGAIGRVLRRRGVKQLIECHNIYPHESNPLDRTLLRFAFAPADYFITHSTRDLNDLSVLAPGKPISICSLPRLDEFSGETASTRAGRTILFFGKVRKYKGLAVLLNAMPKVLSQLDCRLMIVGEFYDSIEKYREIISRLELDSLSLSTIATYTMKRCPAFRPGRLLVLPYLPQAKAPSPRLRFRMVCR